MNYEVVQVRFDKLPWLVGPATWASLWRGLKRLDEQAIKLMWQTEFIEPSPQTFVHKVSYNSLQQGGEPVDTGLYTMNFDVFPHTHLELVGMEGLLTEAEEFRLASMGLVRPRFVAVISITATELPFYDHVKDVLEYKLEHLWNTSSFPPNLNAKT